MDVRQQLVYLLCSCAFIFNFVAVVNSSERCWNPEDGGSSYRGFVWKTISGRTCQPWKAQIPHQHQEIPGNYPYAGLEENYCRNPDGKEGPWCYTIDPNKEWELCYIIKCTDECWDTVTQGDNYRGKVNVTISGKTCQMWTSQKPHGHSRTPENYPSFGLVENYCRNPDGEEAPWCYTTDASQRWEFCAIPTCENITPRVYVGCWNPDDKGASYRGLSATTVSGKPCQPWNSQAPHKHTRTPEQYPFSGLNKNHCRNPDGSQEPWCYTADPDERWEKCGIPQCTTECWDDEIEGASYRGLVAKTFSGRECQKWDSQTPHSHSRTKKLYPFSGLDENYCRNPDGEELPWCYTTDPEKRWEYCTIPSCACKHRAQFYGCWDQADQGKSYRGIAATTIGGRQCQSWGESIVWDHPSSALVENYCRNPEGRNAPWCYIDKEADQWETCCLSSCTSGCWDSQTQGASYRGIVAKTISGKTCQMWDSQFPHQHTRNSTKYPYSDLMENLCRNPDGEPSPWCYTTDKSVRWEFCDIPRCAPGCWSIIDLGTSYRGYASTTESGRSCQSWDLQQPHKHHWDPKRHRSYGLDGNYCRNPEGQKERPWCFTTDMSREWEFCSIPTC